MVRPLRVKYPGAIYHVLSRGDRREAIFRTDADRKPIPGPLGPGRMYQIGFITAAN